MFIIILLFFKYRLDMENDLPSIPFPLCIIPDGKNISKQNF
jgi:hypothetical protein